MYVYAYMYCSSTTERILDSATAIEIAKANEKALHVSEEEIERLCFIKTNLHEVVSVLDFTMTYNDTAQHYEFLNSFVERLAHKIETKTEGKKAQDP